VLPLLLFVGSIVVPASVSAADSRPNILFCIMDDASYMHMSAYGCEWTDTPSFDRLANEGNPFSKRVHAQCEMRSLSIQHSNGAKLVAAWRRRPITSSTFPLNSGPFPEVLRANGYQTGKTGKGWGQGFRVKSMESPVF